MSVPFNIKSKESHFAIGLDFADAIPTGRTLASCTCAARRYDDESDVTSDLLASPTATILSGSTTASIALKANGGTVGVLYEILFKPVLDDGQQLTASTYRVMVDS